MSVLKFCNQTPFIAQYVVRRGDLLVARLPGVAPGASLTVPTYNRYTVVASTVIDGNTYTSAPAKVDSAARFLAQVRQVSAQGTYDFELVVQGSSSSTQMQFEKTTLNPVTFSITQHGAPAQHVVVPDSFLLTTLSISELFTVSAVINGVTTDEITTANPSACITAVCNTSDLEMNYYSLQLR